MKTGEAMLFLIGGAAWVCGIALVKGFWMTAICAVFPPVAWVVLAQHMMGAGS